MSESGRMAVPVSPGWSARLLELLESLREIPDPSARPDERAEAWVLLNAAMIRYLKLHAGRMGRVDPADLEDLAASKSYELLDDAASGRWDLRGRVSGEVPAYVSTVARNALVDFLRRAGHALPLRQDLAYASRDDRLAPEWPEHVLGSEQPDMAAEREEFVRALGECAAGLQPRLRLAWFFRVFYDLSTRDIASHPEVNLKPGHVDVVLQRARQAVTRCMAGKGFQASDMPPGTVTALWRSVRMPAPTPLEGA